MYNVYDNIFQWYLVCDLDQARLLITVFTYTFLFVPGLYFGLADVFCGHIYRNNIFILLGSSIAEPVMGQNFCPVKRWNRHMALHVTGSISRC